MAATDEEFDLEIDYPLADIIKAPDLSLEDALKQGQATGGLDDSQLDACLKCAEKKATKLLKGPEPLTRDEIGAIFIYTVESPFYKNLNNLLRLRNREKLKLLFPYLKLLLTALHKLPPLKGTVFRGVKADVSAKYVKNDEIVWLGFTSTTATASVLDDPLYMGTSGPRTLFSIATRHAVDIRRYSAFGAQQDERLLMPGLHLTVKAKLPSEDGLWFIQLEECTDSPSLPNGFAFAAPRPALAHSALVPVALAKAEDCFGWEHTHRVKVPTHSDCTPVLLEAAQAGLLDVVQYAVEAGASLAATTAEGQTALQLAAQHGHTAVVHFLAAQGPEGTQQLAAVFWREVAAGHADRVEYLLGAGGFGADQTTTDGATALNVAARQGHAAVVRLLLQAEANVDLADNSGRTPLASACAGGHLEVATLLLSAQAQVDREDPEGRTPLYIACQNGNLMLVLRLMSAQASIDHTAKDGSTPQSIAFKNGHVKVAMLLTTAQSSTMVSGPAAPSAGPPPAAPPPAPAPGRQRNRWGDGLEAPAAGNRVFFPTGWVPQLEVPQAIQVFGHDEKQLDFVLSRGKQIASELQQIHKFPVKEGHAAAVFAYTQEDPVTRLYSRCNEACRNTGETAEKRIALFRDYLHHLSQALNVLPTHAGTTYRGVDKLMPPDCYALGKTVTWQAFSSTTRSALQTVRFLGQKGKQLHGSVFVLGIWTGRDIADFSAFPEEQEVLLNLNSVFKVTGRCRTTKEKLTAVPDLGGYDLTHLDVYILTQL